MVGKKKKTAWEEQQELESNPEYGAMRRAREAAQKADEEALRVAELPVLRDLAAAGVGVDRVWDLLSEQRFIPALYPVLLKHIVGKYPAVLREGMARVLAHTKADDYFLDILELYCAEDDLRVKEALGLAASIACRRQSERALSALMPVLRDAKHGESRIMLLGALEKIKAPAADHALLELQDDPELAKEVRRLLSKRKRS
jgi:hypothetical protein